MKVSGHTETALRSILERRLPDGGFCEQPGGNYRADATAWAVLCLNSFELAPEVVLNAREKLCKTQLPDGNIPLTPDYPETYWTTAISSLALANTVEFTQFHFKTINFLLNTGGEILAKDLDSPVGHDTTIRGWSWIAKTHSWTEPTAMAVRALTHAGKSKHERVREGVSLLLDRQLPGGGWNFGGTTVYGQKFNAIPAPSGMVLWALADLLIPEQIATSINLLQGQLPELNTPSSLGWALHGLSAWDVATPKADELTAACLQRQGRYSPYGTSQLAILLSAVNFTKRMDQGRV